MGIRMLAPPPTAYRILYKRSRMRRYDTETPGCWEQPRADRAGIG
jgi:hypothetical protein